MGKNENSLQFFSKKIPKKTANSACRPILKLLNCKILGAFHILSVVHYFFRINFCVLFSGFMANKTVYT